MNITDPVYIAILISMALPSVTCYLTLFARNNYHLNKDYKAMMYYRLKQPIHLPNEVASVNYDKFKESIYQEAITEFCHFMLKKYPKEFLANFYHNINELTINHNKKISILGWSGCYRMDKNVIDINKEYSIYHELFHMASCIINNNTNETICGGFRQISIASDLDIGNSLNEGYTELLTARYFGKLHHLPIVYKNEIRFAINTEFIVGKEAMEKMYFRADLNSLVTELTKYHSKRDILNFIANLDFISKHSDDILLINNNLLEESLVNSYEFFLKTYTLKLKQALDNHLITEEEFVDKSLKYLKMLKKDITICNNKYKPTLYVDMLYNWERVLENNASNKTKKRLNN